MNLKVKDAINDNPLLHALYNDDDIPLYGVKRPYDELNRDNFKDLLDNVDMLLKLNHYTIKHYKEGNNNIINNNDDKDNDELYIILNKLLNDPDISQVIKDKKLLKETPEAPEVSCMICMNDVKMNNNNVEACKRCKNHICTTCKTNCLDTQCFKCPVCRTDRLREFDPVGKNFMKNIKLNVSHSLRYFKEAV